ncbi:META domain-containing protein [Streptomyces sp. NPDC093085]|uniref:META domain-containing protein n=1 Tax=Streptomyces sp. NPDC093085 TaxID=3155068 RepID=UPI00342F3ED7
MRPQKIITTSSAPSVPLTTTVTALTAAALLALTGCGTESAKGAGGGAGNQAGGGAVRTGLPLTGVHWRVDSVTVKGEKTAAPEGASVEITSQGRASARTGCNLIGADVTVDGDTVTVGTKESTAMGCEKDLQEFERTLGGVFDGKLTAKVKEKNLTLTTPGGDAIELTAEESAPFAGTKWTVDALVDGGGDGNDGPADAATSTSLPQGAEGKAYFTFTVSKEAGAAKAAKDNEQSGTIEGSLGCNRFHAAATLSRTTLTLDRISSTRKLCPGPEMSLEQQVRKVLEGKVTYELRHRSVTLMTTGGQGIGAAAPAQKR